MGPVWDFNISMGNFVFYRNYGPNRVYVFEREVL